MSASPLLDNFGRIHDNLRISVTDRCNLRCFYCMPEEGVQYLPRTEVLSFEEIERFVRVAASLGVTSVQHMNPDYADIAVYSELHQRGELITRIYAAPLIPQVDDQVKIGIRHAFGDSYLRLGALKSYADGSLGSGTAYFYQPYLKTPNNRGLLSDTMQPLSLMSYPFLS